MDLDCVEHGFRLHLSSNSILEHQTISTDFADHIIKHRRGHVVYITLHE